MKKYIALIFILLLPSTSYAVGTGNELLKDCSTAVKLLAGDNVTTGFGAGYCMGVIAGASDALIVAWQKDGGKRYFCRPENANNAQLVRVVTKYLKDNPDKLHLSDIALIFLALEKAFPCK